MRVVIVEDEQLSAEKLSRMLIKYNADIEVAAQLESITQCIAWFSQNTADLVFMDIHLSDGNSFAIFEQIQITIPIIFTTAFDQYAIDAFRVNSIDYLLKPFSMDDLSRAIDKYKRLQQPIPSISIEALMAKFRQKQYQQRFLIESGDSIQSISVDEIAYFFADAKYVFMVDKSGQQHIVSQTIDKLTDMLDPQKFFRVT